MRAFRAIVAFIRPLALSVGVMVLGGCATHPPDQWELAAVRIERYEPFMMREYGGRERGWDGVVGTVVSDGPNRDRRVRIMRMSASDLVVGHVYVVKLYSRLHRSLREGANPPEWIITEFFPSSIGAPPAAP